MIRLTRPPCPDPVALRTDYRHPTNKAALQAACFDKCMYCESKVSQVYWGDIEHIRPKARFPHLEFMWENLGYVCARCNNAKSDKWNDETPFIDPFAENPDDHLAALGYIVVHRNGSERGEYSWRELDLNRTTLIERRMERIKAIQTLLDKIARTKDSQLRTLVTVELDQELAVDKEHAMVCRAAFAQLRAAPST